MDTPANDPATDAPVTDAPAPDAPAPDAPATEPAAEPTETIGNPNTAGSVQEEPTPDQLQPGRPSDRAQYSGERDPFYCPGCGRGYGYPAECTGTLEAPHPPIQTVDVEELDGEPDSHTPAPNTD